MEILAQLEELKTNLQAATDAKTVVDGTVTELTATLTAKDGELATAQEAVTAKDTEIESLKAAVTAKDADLAAIQAKVTELTANQKTAEEKAVEIVASQGIAPLKVDADASTAVTAEEAREQYAKLQKEDSVKAGAFFKANSAKILGR